MRALSRQVQTSNFCGSIQRYGERSRSPFCRSGCLNFRLIPEIIHDNTATIWIRPIATLPLRRTKSNGVPFDSSKNQKTVLDLISITCTSESRRNSPLKVHANERQLASVDGSVEIIRLIFPALFLFENVQRPKLAPPFCRSPSLVPRNPSFSRLEQRSIGRLPELSENNNSMMCKIQSFY